MAQPVTTAQPSELACFLLECGWSWGQHMLSQCTEWLAEQGIKERLDLVELDLSDLRGVEKWEKRR
jgi:hypothetical protein